VNLQPIFEFIFADLSNSNWVFLMLSFFGFLNQANYQIQYIYFSFEVHICSLWNHI